MKQFHKVGTLANKIKDLGLKLKQEVNRRYFYAISPYFCYKHVQEDRCLLLDKVINYPSYFKQIVRPKFNFEELIVDGNKEAYQIPICSHHISGLVQNPNYPMDLTSILSNAKGHLHCIL